MNMNGVTYHIHGSGGKPSKQNVSTYEALHSSSIHTYYNESRIYLKFKP